MRAYDLCPSPHLEANDLTGDTPVTILRHEWKQVGKENITKAVLFFKEFNRGMVLNKTNVLRIIRLHGDETEKWIGKTITLYPSETDFNGQTVPCIRVREATK